MYPATFFGLFPPFPRDERAFVAMSFDPRFDRRWSEVIAPAVRRVRVNEVPLEPHRVDLRRASDSILTEILDGIGRCRVVVADITSIGQFDGRPVRNANVLYEVGVAQATRLPEEVIIFRSDADELLFDITNVRVHRYDPDGAPEAAREQIAGLVAEALRELDLKRHLAVRRAAESLDFASWMFLWEARAKEVVYHPARRTMGEALGAVGPSQAIARLLDMGALRAEFVRVSSELLSEGNSARAEELLSYRITPFGSALVDFGAQQMGLLDEGVRDLMEKRISTDEDKTSSGPGAQVEGRQGG